MNTFDTSDASMSEPLIARIAAMARDLRGADDTGDRSFAVIAATAAAQTIALVPGVDHAAVAVLPVDTRTAVQSDLEHATDDVAAALTRVQITTGRLPVPRSLRDVVVSDLTETEHGELHDAAARYGVKSMMTMPLHVGVRAVGVLTAYADTADAFDDDDAVAIGAAVATHVALAALAAGEDKSLRTALASRDVIGQAKGILMERLGIDAAAAFELMARLSQEDNRRLVSIAADVVTTRSRKSVPENE